jgi:hypothetical protein
MSNTITSDDLIASVKAAPGISIPRRQHGDLIYVVTENAAYEIEVLDPEQRIVRISSTDKLLHKPKVGMFVQSVVADGNVGVRGWIKQGLRMQVRFLDRTFQSSAVTSAAIRGVGRNGHKFQYEVF